jgi:hypothetical protein
MVKTLETGYGCMTVLACLDMIQPVYLALEGECTLA